MSLLVECVSVGMFDLIEDASAGKPMRASGVFAVCNEATKNGRRYSEKLWEQNIARLQPAIKARRLVGELDHPSDGRTLLTRASHLITDLRIESRNGKRVVVGDMEVLETARGRDLAALIKGRVEWGVSSRGAGSTKPRADGTEDVSESDFKLYTFDAVFDPAADIAYPTVTESIEQAGYVDIAILESGEQAPSMLAETAPPAPPAAQQTEETTPPVVPPVTESFNRSQMSEVARKISNVISANTGYDADVERHTDDGFDIELTRPGTDHRIRHGASEATVGVKIPSANNPDKVAISLLLDGKTTLIELNAGIVAPGARSMLSRHLKPIIDPLKAKNEAATDAVLKAALAVIESNTKLAADFGALTISVMGESGDQNTLHAQFSPHIPKWTREIAKLAGGKWKFAAVLRDGAALQYKFSTDSYSIAAGKYLVVTIKYDKGSDTYDMELVYMGSIEKPADRVKFDGVMWDDFDQPEKYLAGLRSKIKAEGTDPTPEPPAAPRTEQSGIDPELHARTVDAVVKLTAALNETRGRLAETIRELAISRVVEGHHDPRGAREAIGNAVDPELVAARFEAFTLKSGASPLNRALSEVNDLGQKLAEAHRRVEELTTESQQLAAARLRAQGFAEVARRLAEGRGIQVDHLIGQLTESNDVESVRRLVQESATLIPATGKVADAIHEAMARRRGKSHEPTTDETVHSGVVESLAGIPIRDLVERAG